MEYIYPDWNELEQLCKELADKCRDYSPNVLVGISRGGLVPVRLLSDYLGNPNVAIIKIEFYLGVGKTKGRPEIVHPISTDVKGKKVLIVDDVADSGRSLVDAKKYIEKLGAKEVRVAILHIKPSSIFKPDYFIGETDAWIVYPWEKKEVERELKKDT
jgi:hypoxanthine phosphoribosyltransferase